MTKRKWQLLGIVAASGIGIASIIADAFAGSFPAVLMLMLMLAIPFGVLIEVRELRRDGKSERIDDMIRLTLQTAVFAMILAMLGQARVDSARHDCAEQAK